MALGAALGANPAHAEPPLPLPLPLPLPTSLEPVDPTTAPTITKTLLPDVIETPLTGAGCRTRLGGCGAWRLSF
ncbi:hypothetical protein F8271_31385 [Micromonospora sp. ALFpr18c]|nr:hypothetical protein F8271_31385 [Micromonospora sp. ALFpr18c]